MISITVVLSRPFFLRDEKHIGIHDVIICAISDLKWYAETNIHRRICSQRGVCNYRCPSIAPNWPRTCSSLPSELVFLFFFLSPSIFSSLCVFFCRCIPGGRDPSIGFLIIVFCIQISTINTRSHSM